MNKQQLASKIWEAANKMRSKIEANEYKDYILGFIFYKFLSDKEEKFLKEHDFGEEDIANLNEEDKETVDYINGEIGYFISYSNLFSTWLKLGLDFDVSNVHEALSAFNRNINPVYKKVFEKIFITLETGLSKLGDSSGSQSKAIKDLLQLIKVIPMDGKQDYDVLGFIYEYLISMFAANAGKKAGEFYTPHEVSILMSEIVANHLQGKTEIKIFDPTSGSGSLLINIGKSVSRHINKENSIKYYAQELKENTYNLTRMNLVMRGILPANIVTRNADTLEADWPFFEENDPIHTYEPLYVDAVVSNPPYSQSWDPSNKDGDPRYAFGLAPKSKADYAFLLHDLYHVKPDGIMTIVLPHGVLFRGGEEGKIRENLIEHGNIDAIIGLPANIFFGTSIPTIIMVLKHDRSSDDVLIIDASKGFEKVGKNNRLRASDIKRIADTVRDRASIKNFSRLVSRDEIRTNDYNLNIPRYVDTSDQAENWDIYALMFGGVPESEIDNLADYWKAFPSLKDALFSSQEGSNFVLKVSDIRQAVSENIDVKRFASQYVEAFSDLNQRLKESLIGNYAQLNIANEEAIISEDIFSRLDGLPLVDKYEVFQILDDEWTKIAIDLEIMQTEGFDAVKKVDPRMVLKKEEEVQDGWKGHVMPFDFIGDVLLKEQQDRLRSKEDRLAEIKSEYDEILDSLSEEEKSSDYINDAQDSFIPAEVAKQVKAIKKSKARLDEDSFEAKLVKADLLMAEEKTLKVQIKKETLDLELKTKDTIENLTDEQAELLLEKKWIEKLIQSINALPETLIKTLISKIEAMCRKYEITFAQVESEIHETERSLLSMLKDLMGSEEDLKGLGEFCSFLEDK